MGELQHEAFQFAFNGFLKVAFQGSRVTSDAGLLLVRELDERLGLEALISEYLNDSRQGLNTQFSLADLLRHGHLVGRPVVELGRARALMRGDRLGALERTAIEQIRRDARGPEGVAIGLAEPDGLDAPLDHPD